MLVIAFSQFGVWERIKYQSRMPAPQIAVTVMARQWEWRMRYPSEVNRFHYEGKEKEAEKQRAARAWAENRHDRRRPRPQRDLHVWKGRT